MPNHFDLNDGGFDNLLEDDPVVTEPTSTEPTSVDIPDNTIDEPTEPKNDNSDENPSPENDDEGDFLLSFLNGYGLKDGKVTYENDDGSTEEVDFNDLSSKEKLNILKELTATNLSQEEIKVINYLRANNATIQDVINYYSNKAIEDYINQNGPVEKHYEIDEYSDDEVYVADLRSKFEDMTDDEIKADLELAKENEDLFKKKVETIRKRYKEQEEEYNNQQKQEQEARYNDFKQSLSDQLHNFNEISMDYKDSKSDSLEIDDQEKENIYNYILDLDENGTSQFFKDLNDPQKLIELAWFSLYGKEAISDISNYWKGQLKTSRRNETKPQTTIVKQDIKDRKDNFFRHRNTVETDYGENLL